MLYHFGQVRSAAGLTKRHYLPGRAIGFGVLQRNAMLGKRPTLFGEMREEAWLTHFAALDQVDHTKQDHRAQNRNRQTRQREFAH
jgi:hypothetical protein